MARKLTFLILTLPTVLSTGHPESLAAEPKILVAYFSRTGNTREIAYQIHRLIGGEELGLTDGWQKVVPKAVYGDIFRRNLGAGPPLNLDRGIHGNRVEPGSLLSPYLD
jgi:hypothetical protein